MEFMSSFRVCASGLAAQRAKMDVIVSNLANINTTRTSDGGPYRRKAIVFSSEPLTGSFDDVLQIVKVKGITEERESIRMVFDPDHPDADSKGIVAMPDINKLLKWQI